MSKRVEANQVFAHIACRKSDIERCRQNMCLLLKMTLLLSSWTIGLVVLGTTLIQDKQCGEEC